METITNFLDTHLIWFVFGISSVVVFTAMTFIWKFWHRHNQATPPSNTTPFHPRPVFDRNGGSTAVRDWLHQDIQWLQKAILKKEEEHHEETPEVNETIYWVVTAVVVGILTLLLVTAWLLLPAEIRVFGFPISPPIIFSLPILAYLLKGFRAIDTDKLAGLDFAGKPVRQLGNGLTWYLWGVFTLTEETAQLVQGELPGDADHIFWQDEEKDLPTGKVRPIYVLSGEQPDGRLPSEIQANLGISLAVKFQLVPERFWDLVRNIAPIDPDNGQLIREVVTGNTSVSDRLLEVLRHLRDTASAFAGEIIGQLSYNEITRHRALIDQWLAERIRLEIITWGLKLQEARFTQINPGHQYNKDLQLRSRATAERDALGIRAAGEKTQLVLQGEGKAAATRAQLEAQAAGYAKIMSDLSVSGEAVLASQVGEKIAAGGNAVIADGLGGLGAMVAAGAKAFGNMGSKTPANPGTPSPTAGSPAAPGIPPPPTGGPANPGTPSP